MPRRGDPMVLRLLVAVLRCHTGMSQEEFAVACGTSQGQISRYESGQVAPSEKTLRRMAKVAGLAWPLVAHLRQYLTLFLAAAARGSSGSPARALNPASLEPVLLAVTPYLLAAPAAPRASLSPEGAFKEADQIWAALEGYPMPYRRRLIELSPRSGSWALAVRVCEASVKSAAHKAAEALELAELALEIAERVPEEEGWRSRLKGYCWAHMGNARRVANDLSGADTAFAQAWHLWDEESDSHPGPLSGWRICDLEASLRLDQRRFPEALQRLEQARAGCGNDPLAAGRILLKKEQVFDELGDAESALAVLVEATPLIEPLGDARLLWILLFMKTKNLVHLEHYGEAAELLPQVQDLAVELGNELDLLRVDWLRSKVAAGLGRPEEAIAGLEQVSQIFTDRELPYDAALSSLDLAVLLLEAGRTQEVKELAVTLGKIFNGTDFSREALAALTLFCDAAHLERATVEQARKVITEIERAGRAAPRG